MSVVLPDHTHLLFYRTPLGSLENYRYFEVTIPTAAGRITFRRHGRRGNNFLLTRQTVSLTKFQAKNSNKYNE